MVISKIVHREHVLVPVVYIFLSSVTLSGCNSGLQSATAEPVVSTPTQVASKSANPVRICIFQDKTRSTDSTRTGQVKWEDLSPLIDLLRQTGGELACGLIRDTSNRSLRRLLIKPPPSKPAEPDKHGNPFNLALLRAAYEQSRAKYNSDYREWQAEVDQGVLQFKNELKPLLDQKADAGKTDIWSAVLRADLFLNESDAGWPQPTHRYLILVTDGLHNTNATAVPMKSGAKALMVNGAASLGSLERLNPLRFEAIQPAFHFIVASEQAGGK